MLRLRVGSKDTAFRCGQLLPAAHEKLPARGEADWWTRLRRCPPYLLGSDAFVVDTESQQEAGAVYLLHPKDPHLRIWLNTLGQAPEHYGVHIEHLDEDTFNNYESLSLTALVDLLSVELEVAEIRPLP